jgi:signal transduction histidine kinase
MFRYYWLPLCLFLIGSAPKCSGQKASNWRSFKVVDHLPESACISVTFSPQGKVLVRHFSAPFVSELDGYTVRTIPSPEIGRSRVYQSPGGQLWAVVPDGLQEFREGEWILHRIAELDSDLRSGASRVIDPIPLWPVRQGVVLLLVTDRLLEYNCEDPQRPRVRVIRQASATHLGGFTGLTPAKDGGLWICGFHGIARIPAPVRSIKPETEWTEHLVPDSLQVQSLHGLHEDDDGGVSAVAETNTNQQRTALYFDGHDWSAQTAGSDRLRQAWRSGDKFHWAMSTEALFEGDGINPDLHETDEISARAYFDVAVQAGSAFWLATSDGLFRYAPSLWQSPAVAKRLNAPVRCFASDPSGGIWFAANARLWSLQGDQLKLYSLPAATGRNLESRAVYVLSSGAVVVALEDPESAGRDSLYVLRPGGQEFSTLMPKDSSGTNLRALGLLKDGRLCVRLIQDGGSEAKDSLRACDGSECETMATPSIPSTLGTNWYSLFEAQNGDWWLSTENGTAQYSQENWKMYLSSSDKSTPQAAGWFLEIGNGRIWCAAQDMVWEFDGHSWSVIRRGFDHINRMLRTRDGSIWIASNGGLLRYFQDGWIENGPEEGLPSSSVRDILEDQRGRIWAATSRGLSLFHPEADPDPPQTSVQLFPWGDASISEGGTVSLNFSGQDRWKYTPRERLLYSYRLDVRDWSGFQEATRVSYNDLPAGKHYFQVRAMDRNGNVDSHPARREFVVIGPWYRETRLVLISFAGGVAVIFFAGLAFNRHRRLLRSYAEVERKVADRTRELEIANRELVHSQKMNALGTLAAGIAHDFNNILSIIKGSTQIIEENLQNPDKIQTRTDRIKLVVEQGAGIVKAMLGFSRDSGREPAICDVNEVVQDTLKLLGDRFLREVHVHSTQTPGLPGVLAAKDFIQQILLNLIFNAAESMESGKEIQLSTRLLTELPADLVLPPVPAARYVAVSVRDSGCGIPLEILPRIFEPFFTTKALSTRRGTGLGLSMAYELAKKLGAGLAVASAVGSGSTFTLILPVRELAHP